ncbi:MAG: hypothetical protein NXY57DRAFT_1003642 [Lentinula lateritia]|nr:MAG: hypothetical protein NXY57DRAFT_1003642 [Lentinula lateritia]
MTVASFACTTRSPSNGARTSQRREPLTELCFNLCNLYLTWICDQLLQALSVANEVMVCVIFEAFHRVLKHVIVAMKDLHIDVEDGERLSPLLFLTLIASLDPGWIPQFVTGPVKRERSWRVLRMTYTPEHTVTCLLMSNERSSNWSNGITKNFYFASGPIYLNSLGMELHEKSPCGTIGVSKPRMAFPFLLADRLIQGYVYSRIRGCFGLF